MKTALVITLVLVGMLTLAAVQDGPLQVWLLILAPFAFIGAAAFLNIADGRNNDWTRR